ncbi:MAG: glycosyltransferase family 39 protein [Devosia sp.]
MILFWRAIPKLVLTGFVLLAIALLAQPIQLLTAHIPLSYNEGWNAFHTLRLRSGGLLYPPISPAIFINYPPLSFNIVASLSSLIGDDIVAGRIVALIALAITTLNVGIAACRLGANTDLAAIAALAFFCFIALFFSDYIGVDDPQWLAQAFQSTALVILLRNRRDWLPLASAACLIVAGGLIKHNVIELPIAVTLWLAIEDRASLRRWLVASLVAASIALAICYALYGQNFTDQVIGSGRGYTLALVGVIGRTWGPQLAPFVIVAAVGAWLQRRTPNGRFIGIYIAASLTLGFALMTGSGVIYNTLFDLVIAMMLGCALFCQTIADRTATTPRAQAMVLALMSLLFALRFIMLAPGVTLAGPDVATRQAWTATIDRIRTEPGPVACETLALCYWASRQSEIEFFNFGQRARLDPGYDAAFAAQLQSGAIGLIQLDIDLAADRLPPALEAIIAQRYVQLQSTPTILMVPKP